MFFSTIKNELFTTYFIRLLFLLVFNNNLAHPGKRWQIAR